MQSDNNRRSFDENLFLQKIAALKLVHLSSLVTIHHIRDAKSLQNFLLLLIKSQRDQANAHHVVVEQIVWNAHSAYDAQQLHDMHISNAQEYEKILELIREQFREELK